MEKSIVSLSEVGTNYKTLVTESRIAKKWLYERGFTNQMIAHYRLGVKRCKRLDKLWTCISIPIPADTNRTKFYQKLRIQPWTEGEDRPKELSKWSQKGIPASVWFTWFPSKPQETFLCEGEWDAMMLGYLAKQCNSPIAVATFTCGCETVPNENELEKLVGKVTIFYDRNDKPNGKTGERPGDKGALHNRRRDIEVLQCNVHNVTLHTFVRMGAGKVNKDTFVLIANANF